MSDNPRPAESAVSTEVRRLLPALGDPARRGAALNELVAVVGDRVCRMIYSVSSDPRVRRRFDREDIFQEVSIRLVTFFQGGGVPLTEPRQLYGLIGTMIRRQLIDLNRKVSSGDALLGRNQTPGADDPGHLGLLAGAVDDPGEPTVPMQWAEFHEAVERLDDDERQYFDAFFYDRLPAAEAAARIGVPVDTARRVWRALRQRFAQILPS